MEYVQPDGLVADMQPGPGMEDLQRDALTNGNLMGYILRHPRDQRWKALSIAAVCAPSRKVLATLFREVWEDSESIWSERRIIGKLLRTIRVGGNEKWLFTEADRRAFNALPEKLKIYRGAKPWNRNGMSWTLDLHRASFFACYHSGNGFKYSLRPEDTGFVMEKTVSKRRVLFYNTERDENEIVLPRFERGDLCVEGTKMAVERALEVSRRGTTVRDSNPTARYDIMLGVRAKVQQMISEGKSIEEVLAAKVTATYESTFPGGLLSSGSGISADRYVRNLYSQLKGGT
jgi:hypothetical protein